jgi:hypothetical protein
MAHLDRSPSLTWLASDSAVSVRPKPDRRRFYRDPIQTLDDTILNVILRQGEDFRQWSIRQRDLGWECRVLTPTAITVCGCETDAEAIAQKRRWESEIATARADGWA